MIDLSLAMGARDRTTSRASMFRSTETSSTFISPASIFARSRTSFTRRVSLSASALMMVMNSRRSSSDASASDRRISEKERMDVSGVRSSWETEDRKLSFTA